jgi:hypothetical protein
MREALKSPTAMTILALKPDRPLPAASAEKPDGSDLFHGYKILGKADVDDAALRAKVVSLVERAVSDSDGTVAACFLPRHGVRIENNGKIVELVICFECHSMKGHGPDGSEFNPSISASVEGALSDVFRSRGLTIAP